MKKYFYFIRRKNRTERSGVERRSGGRERHKVKNYFYFIRRKNGTEQSGAERRRDKEGG